MKKFLEKHDLFKLLSICIFIVVIFSWIISSSYYSGGTIQYDEINRIGIMDIATYSLVSIMYFFLIYIFIFVVSGFYKFLGGIPAYNKLTSGIASKFEGKEKLFVAITIFVFACLAGITIEYVVLFAIIPFVISILSKLKVDKVTGFAATFGGVLVGVIGGTYNAVVSGMANASSGIGIEYGYELITAIILFIITYLLLTFFVFGRMKNVKGNKDVVLLEDPYATIVVETKGKKDSKKHISVIGMVLLLLLTFVVLILGFIGWSDVFGLDWATKAYDWVSNATLFGQNIFAYLLGIHDSSNIVQLKIFKAFGQWDLLLASGTLLISMLLIKVVHHIPFSKMLDDFTDGLKISVKTIGLIVMVYTIWMLSVIFPTIPSVAEKITGLIGSNIGSLFINGAITSIFVVDFQYICSVIGPVFANFKDLNVAAMTLQTSYGLVQFIAPTSLMLVIGLSTLNIKFKDYFKFIWKFLLAMLVIIIIILAILMYA